MNLLKKVSSIFGLGQGQIYYEHWFEEARPFVQPIHRVFSWDTATTANKNSAYSACVIGDVLPSGHIYIRHVYRGKLKFPFLLQKIGALLKEYNLKNTPMSLVIENKSSGTRLLKILEKTTIRDFVVSYSPKGSKIERAVLASEVCRKKAVIFSRRKQAWKEDFFEELYSFPNCSYFDQVDAFNQLILFTKELYSDLL